MFRFESHTSDRGDSFQHRCIIHAHILAQMQHRCMARCMHVAPILEFHAVFELSPTVQFDRYPFLDGSRILG
jgi:methyl coenzyme M reductase beta subunit